jgi:hypothetical protein
MDVVVYPCTLCQFQQCEYIYQVTRKISGRGADLHAESLCFELWALRYLHENAISDLQLKYVPIN